MEPWTYKRNVGRLRMQRKRSLNLELSKWSVGRPNGTLDAQMERGTFAQAAKTLLKRFYQTLFGLVGFNALRIKSLPPHKFHSDSVWTRHHLDL